MELSNYKNFREYQLDNYDKNLTDKLMNMIKNIPDSNGSRYYEKIDLNVAIITDEFMYNYYKDAVNLIYINYFNYKEILENNDIDIFMFVTCWRGMEDNDWRAGNPYGGLQKQRVIEVIDICKSKGIVTIFQSKEDPSNYKNFVNIAKKCDYIFTTDKDKISDYKEYCRNENVYLLEFGINPLLHNPIGIKKHEKLNNVLFAGSWMSRYLERCEDMVKIFDGIIESENSINIIDRNFDLELEPYYYPKKYIPYTIPSISYREIQKIHKLYNWIINLNSIKYSSTMCAARIYEAQALGNVIISNYSKAVNMYNPNVFIINNKSEVDHILNSYTEEEIYKHQVYGIRNVMTDKTVFERLDYLLKTAGLDYKMNLEKSILVVAKELNDNIVNEFNRQLYENKTLVEIQGVKDIYQEYDYITFFNDEYIYEEYYLQDIINGFKYTDSDYITKDSYYLGNKIIEGINHEYVDKMKDKYKTIFDIASFDINYLIDLEGEVNLERGYSIDCFELRVLKNNVDTSSILGGTIDKIKGAIKKYIPSQSKYNEYKINQSIDYKMSVIVAVYNNGKHLLNKCFNSLKRSSIFREMEIILVDDGSTDEETLIILERLKRENNNVVLYKFEDEDGGSGSASRPRNKGIELSTSKYITFLDPDNEAVNDGYFKLYKEIKESQYDVVLGHALKLSNKESYFKYILEGIIENPKQHNINSKFKVASIQAALINKDIITNNSIKMIEGALGQDTLFFIELMMNARRGKAIYELIHIYYAAVENSVTNTIGKFFYNKSYILQKQMPGILDKYGVKDIYIDKKLEYFYRYRYMKELRRINEDELEEVCEIMLKILEAYEHTNIKDGYIKRFIDYIKVKDYDSIKKEYLQE